MQIIAEQEIFHILEPVKTAVAIGKFDGIHIGHQTLLREILMEKEKGMKAAIFTFDPPPDIFFGNRSPQELTTRDEKRKLFQKLGIDYLIEYPLNKKTAAIQPEQFIQTILVDQMKAGVIVAGKDLSFGDQGRGNCQLLEQMAETYDYQVRIIDKVCIEDREISSSYVREEVAAGRMEQVEKLIGEPYSITGLVQHGYRFGRTIGMPTVNLLPENGKLLPPFGVYFSTVEVNGSVYRGITNIGCKPTVTDDQIVGIETYLYDFQDEIYGEEITVRLLHYKRPEMKFKDIEELKSKTQEDMEEGKLFFR